MRPRAPRRSPQARTLFATFMCTVLFGYLLQFSQSHPARFWFIYLTNWCALPRLPRYAHVLTHRMPPGR